MPKCASLSRNTMEKRVESGKLLLGNKLSNAIKPARRMENLYRIK